MSRAADLRLLERTGALVAQLFFIAAGVYLGNRADAWKEERSHREAARGALENFRTEMRLNRADVARKQPEHYRLGQALLKVGHDSRPMPRSIDGLFGRVGWKGSYPLEFRDVAWNLALANQSLTYVDPKLSFAIADVYGRQRELSDYQQSTLRNALSPAALRPDGAPGLAFTLMAFFTDASKDLEPALIRTYDALLPRLDSALARTPR